MLNKLFYFLYFLCRIYFFCVLNTITPVIHVFDAAVHIEILVRLVHDTTVRVAGLRLEVGVRAVFLAVLPLQSVQVEARYEGDRL